MLTKVIRSEKANLSELLIHMTERFDEYWIARMKAIRRKTTYPNITKTKQKRDEYTHKEDEREGKGENVLTKSNTASTDAEKRYIRKL